MTQPGKTYDPSRYAASPPQNRDLAQQRHQEVKENAGEFDTNRSASTRQQKGGQRNNSVAAAAALGQDGPPNSKPFLDFQTSFVYGSTYENSRGREAFENSILKPLMTIGNPPLPADAALAETREFWKARFGEAGILVRDDTSRRRDGASRSVHMKPTQTRAFEEWRAEKLRQRSEELARQEALRKEEEERAARASRKSARAVKSWERQKKKQAREARIEARRAQRAKRKEEKKKRAKQQKAEKKLEEQTILALQSAAAESAQARAARAAARAREREEQRARAARNEEAFQEWIEAKKRQQAAEARRRAENERIRREVAASERERKWAKKDVVLAYTGALSFDRDGLSVSLASRDEAKSQSSLD